MSARLELKQLTKIYSSGDGIRAIDLRVEPGEIHALVGLNGAGKSTLMRLALGMQRPDSGTVCLSGTPIEEAGSHIWESVGKLIEYPLAYRELSVRQNLMLSARLQGLEKQKAQQAVEHIIAELDLGRFSQRIAKDLSLGNKQRVGLGAALLHYPDLIILDEPTNALDPAGMIHLREHLLRRAEGGAGILVSSHHLDEVARIAQRITVINRGRIIATLDPGQPEIERAFFALLQADQEPAYQ